MATLIFEARNGECCFFCAATGFVFGPVFPDRVIASGFEQWCREQWPSGNGKFDMLNYQTEELETLWGQFLVENPLASREVAGVHAKQEREENTPGEGIPHST